MFVDAFAMVEWGLLPGRMMWLVTVSVANLCLLYLESLFGFVYRILDLGRHSDFGVYADMVKIHSLMSFKACEAAYIEVAAPIAC